MYQVHPEAPHNDVVDGDGGLIPRVVALGPMEDQVAATNGVADDILPPELGGESVFLPECPILALCVHCKHGRVVADLGKGGRGGMCGCVNTGRGYMCGCVIMGGWWLTWGRGVGGACVGV